MTKKNKCPDFVARSDNIKKNCNVCLMRHDCKCTEKKYIQVMRCDECIRIMDKSNELEILGINKTLSKLEIYSCWKCKKTKIRTVGVNSK